MVKESRRCFLGERERKSLGRQSHLGLISAFETACNGRMTDDTDTTRPITMLLNDICGLVGNVRHASRRRGNSGLKWRGFGNSMGRSKGQDLQ